MVRTTGEKQWVLGLFLGVNRPGRGIDHPSPSSAKVKERVQLYLYTPSGPLWPVLGRTFTTGEMLQYAVLSTLLLLLTSQGQTPFLAPYCRPISAYILFMCHIKFHTHIKYQAELQFCKPQINSWIQNAPEAELLQCSQDHIGRFRVCRDSPVTLKAGNQHPKNPAACRTQIIPSRA